MKGGEGISSIRRWLHPKNAWIPKSFFRINRKFIVSFSAIKEMIRYSNNRIKIGLSPLPPENIEAIVSADRIREFRDWLNR